MDDLSDPHGILRSINVLIIKALHTHLVLFQEEVVADRHGVLVAVDQPVDLLQPLKLRTGS